MEIYMLIILIFLFGLIALTPYFIRPEILFGYRVGERLGKQSGANRIRKKFVIVFLSAFGLEILLTLLLFGSIMGTTLLPFLFMITFFLSYLLARKDAEKYFNLHKDQIKLESKVVVSTVKRTNVGVSFWWLLIPLIISLSSFVILYFVYDQLPAKIPMRYDLQGNITGYESKSVGKLLTFPIITLVMTALFYYILQTIRKSKEDLDIKNPKTDQIRRQRFKKVGAMVIIYVLVVISIHFFYLFLVSTQIIPYNHGLNIILSILLPLVLIFPPIIMAVFVGQGGSRIKLADQNNEIEEQKEVVRDDNRYWKLGLFYFNPDDPAVWVEKRFGIGWTLNFARPVGWLFILGVVVLILLSFLL